MISQKLPLLFILLLFFQSSASNYQSYKQVQRMHTQYPYQNTIKQNIQASQTKIQKHFISTDNTSLPYDQFIKQQQDPYYSGLIHGFFIGVFSLVICMVIMRKRNGAVALQQNKSNNITNDIKSKEVIRCMLFGQADVGKTCIILIYCSNSYSQQYIPTIGANFRIKDLNNSNLIIWDTAGQQKYKISEFSYIKGIKIFYIIYDCQNKSSFQKIPQMITSLRQNHPSFKEGHLCIVANKIDTERRQINSEQGKALAESYNAAYFEVSAKNDQGISDLFDDIPSWMQYQQENEQSFKEK